jgi:hypothetical protein
VRRHLDEAFERIRQTLRTTDEQRHDQEETR